MPRITRRLEWDAGHRVLGHEGKCSSLHGHRYAAEVTVDAPELDALGRVVDFGVVKERVGGWVDAHWDHTMLLHRDDPLCVYYLSPLESNSRRPYVMPGGLNPTAETIAAELFKQACALLPPPLAVWRVRVYETPSCWADCYQNETASV